MFWRFITRTRLKWEMVICVFGNWQEISKMASESSRMAYSAESMKVSCFPMLYANAKVLPKESCHTH